MNTVTENGSEVNVVEINNILSTLGQLVLEKLKKNCEKGFLNVKLHTLDYMV